MKGLLLACRGLAAVGTVGSKLWAVAVAAGAVTGRRALLARLRVDDRLELLTGSRPKSKLELETDFLCCD